MARTPFTLAALATAAVPGLDVAATRGHSTGEHGDFDSAVLSIGDGRELIIRVPRTPAAEREQATDLVGLQALSAGVRSRLPFDAPTAEGQTPIDGTRAVVYDFLPGRPLRLEDVSDELAGAVGRAIAAIHSLNSGFIGENGLPSQSAEDARGAVTAVVERAQATGSLPAALYRRWLAAADDETLWRFQPTVINGALAVDSLLADGTLIVGVLGWSGLSIGDPARDLAWVLGAAPEGADAVFDAYGEARQVASDPHLAQRALLHAELDLARWLLHGHELHDPAIISDAEQMLAGLVDRVHHDGVDPLMAETGPVLSADQVEQLLAASPNQQGPTGHSAGFAPVPQEPGANDGMADASSEDDAGDEAPDDLDDDDLDAPGFAADDRQRVTGSSDVES